MVDYKLTINDSKTGKSYKKEFQDNDKVFQNAKIGDKVIGDAFEMSGYELEITGGSDNCGFPMRKDIPVSRKKILTVEGVGVKLKNKGIRQRKTVCGNKITENIAQINLKILKYGKSKLGAKETTDTPKEEEKAPKEEVPKEEKSKEEAPSA